MAPFNMLMAWADLIPPLYMTSILDVEFFPKWLTVLHRWLSETADYAEVAPEEVTLLFIINVSYVLLEA